MSKAPAKQNVRQGNLLYDWLFSKMKEYGVPSAQIEMSKIKN